MRERAISIERRIELRSAAVLGRLRESLVVVTPDELEALLNAYEHGGFRTRETL